MINEDKVKIMTRLAIYENTKGKKELPLSKYYKSDYKKYNVLKTIVSATISYWLLVALYIMSDLEKFMESLNTMDYAAFAYGLLTGFAVFLIAYCIISSVIASKQYEDAKPNIIIYNHNLKKLLEIYEKEGAEVPKSIEERGVTKGNDEFIDY